MPSLPGAYSTKAPKDMMRATLPVNTSPTFSSRTMPSMMDLAFCAAASSVVAMKTLPSSSMSIFTPVSSMILLIILPRGPTTSPIFSGLMKKWMIFGAYLDRCGRGAGSASSILSSMCMRPSCACASA